MKNNYNFGVVKFHLKFNQRTKSTSHKFQTHFPCQNLILFQPDLCLRKKGMISYMEYAKDNSKLEKWQMKKKDKIHKNKLLTVVLIAFVIFSTINFIMIYNFINILSEL